MPAQQFFIFSQPTLLQTTVRRLWPREQLLCALQHARCQAVFKCRRDPDRKIALNPYKLAISLQRCLIKKLTCAKRNWRYPGEIEQRIANEVDHEHEP
jgi:hypothetical protein